MSGTRVGGTSPDTSRRPAGAPPASANPWDTLRKPIEGDHPELDFDQPLTVGLVNQDKDMRRKAAFIGENRLAADLEKKRGLISRAVVRCWKGGLARNYYRQKYINQARKEIMAGNSLALEETERERRHYNRDVCETFIDQTEGMIDESTGDVRKSLKNEHPDLYDKVREIVTKYARGDIATPEDAKEQFDQAIASLQEDGIGFGDDNLKVSNLKEVAIKARNRYEAMMTVAESAHSIFDHNAAMDRVMVGFDVLYGQREKDRLTPNYNKVDKLVAKAQEKLGKTKLGSMVSSEHIAIAVGVAASVSEVCTKRIPGKILSLVPGLGAGVLAGVKAGADFERDRDRADYDERYNREYSGDQKRRKKIKETLHSYVKVNDVRDDLSDKIKEFEQAKKDGRDVTALRDSLLRATARCKTYLSLDKTRKSVLSYSSEMDAPKENLMLLKQFCEAKQYLRDNGVADLDTKLDNTSDLMTDAIQEVAGDNVSAKKRARKQKIKDIMKKSAISFGVGTVFSLGAQEVRALMNDNVQGIFEKANGTETSTTSLRKFANLFSPKATKPEAFTTTYSVLKGEVRDSAGNIDFQKAKDGTFNLMKDGKVVAKGIDWNAETGRMTQGSIEKLRAQGFRVEHESMIHETVPGPNIEKTRTWQVKYSDGPLKAGATKVYDQMWYDNDSVNEFDFNEQGLSKYTAPDGSHGVRTYMVEGGSWHNGDHLSFKSEAMKGNIKMAIYPSSKYYRNPIIVDATEVLEDGNCRFVPEPGSPAAQCFGPNGELKAWHTEIIDVRNVKADGSMAIKTLATKTGECNADPIFTKTESYSIPTTKDIDIPQYRIIEDVADTEKPWNVPIMFPFVSGRAMNESKAAPFQNTSDGWDPNRSYPYGYGYEYSNGYNNYGGYPNSYGYGEGGWISGEPYSPSIEAGKMLNPNEESHRYSREMRNTRGDAYQDKIETMAQSSPELMTMDERIKTIVTIPVHGASEDPNTIYKTISLYAQQRNVDMNSFMLAIDLNWRQVEKPGFEANVQAIRDIIKKARADFPQLRIAVYEEPGHRGIGEVANTMFDVVNASLNHAKDNGRMSPEHDVLIIRTDADAKHLSNNYIASYQEAAEKNPKTPIFMGSTWFDINRTKNAPSFGAVMLIERLNNLFGAVSGNINSIYTEGRNFAYKASALAAANGYGFRERDPEILKRAGTDDVITGFRIIDAYRKAYESRMDGSGNPADGDLMDPSTRMAVQVGNAVIDTDDLRHLALYDPTDPSTTTSDAYGDRTGYNANPIRPAITPALMNFREVISDRQKFNATVAQFEREMSRFFEWHNPAFLNRTLNWFFGTDDISEICTVDTRYANDGRKICNFKFTPVGYYRFRQALFKRMGDGLDPSDHNTLQQAVSNGDWLAPIAA